MKQTKKTPAKAKEKSKTTEERIKQAAHRIFLKHGYSGARTRDVAKEAGINVALLNYYFRSKENLFNVVMLEKIQQLIGNIIPALNDASITLEEKTERIVHSYIDFLLKNPDMPLFVLNEIRKEGFEFIDQTRFGLLIRESSFMKQLKEVSGEVNPAHFLISLLSMTIFPFAARPILLKTGLVNDQFFEKMMEERKKLIPVWIRAILSTQK